MTFTKDDEIKDDSDPQPKVFDYNPQPTQPAPTTMEDPTSTMTDPLVASLNRTLAHKDTLKSSLATTKNNNTLGDSLAYSQTGGGLEALKNSIKNMPMEAIPAEEDEGTSQTSGKKQRKEEREEGDEEGDDIGKCWNRSYEAIDRFEDIGEFSNFEIWGI